MDRQAEPWSLLRYYVNPYEQVDARYQDHLGG
jgi:hypothetical protein